MKCSKYNRFINLDDKVLAFNCISCAFAELDLPTFEALQALDGEQLENYLHELRRGRFVIDDDLDEVGELKLLYNLRKYSTSTIGLTIAPTMACNFRCIYCYEGELPPVVMSDDVQQSIVNLLSRHIETLNGVGISWYGGEPLLTTEVVYSLSDKLIELCAEHHCNYEASVITNGWLLSREVAEHLRDRKVNTVQVTLDGPPEIHNARRPLQNGKGTFERILDNITAAADVLRIVVRINIDTTNLDGVLELYKLLHERDILGKVHPYLGQVSALTQACADIEPDCLGTEDFSSIELELHRKLRAHGLAISLPYPRFLSNYCGVLALQSYVVDPLGDLYKCWHHLGNKKEAIGNLMDASNQQYQNPRFIKWMALDHFEIPECRECTYLPLCSGGCPEYYLQGKYEHSSAPNCISWRYNVDDVLLDYYQEWKKAQRATQAKA